MSRIVRYQDLAQHLDVSRHVIRKNWKQLPHFFVSRGRDLRSARFDVDEVVEFLKSNNILSDEQTNVEED